MEVTVQDDVGEIIRLERPAQRVIALYGGLADIMAALDAQNLLVARTKADANTPGMGRLPSIGTHMQPNIELVASLQPDLVLQLSGRTEASLPVEALRKLGINVAMFEINSFDQLFEATRKIGVLTGRTKQAEKIMASWQERLAALGDEETQGSRPSVLYEIRYPNLLAAGATGMVNEIITLAGGRNVVHIPKKMARLSEEAVIAADPDAYISQKGPMNPAAGKLEDREHFRDLRAVTNGNVLVVDERIFARPGPGSILAAENLRRWFQERFAGERGKR